METATFGGGCFWGVEAAFLKIEGVRDATSGYMGGSLDNPTYNDVCTDGTGHAEVVQVRYDPAEVSFGELLDVFWTVHDPTTLNRQGPDVGTQYRSVIFYHDEGQKLEVASSIERLEKSGRFSSPVVTAIVPASKFYPAEEYHQRYYEKHGIQSCHL